MEISESLVRSLLESNQPFPVNFDDAWQWIGYLTEKEAKDHLVKNFKKGIDYITRPRRWDSTEHISLTVDCFKSLAMMAGTKKGKEVRHYFLDLDRDFNRLQKSLKSRTPTQQDSFDKKAAATSLTCLEVCIMVGSITFIAFCLFLIAWSAVWAPGSAPMRAFFAMRFIDKAAYDRAEELSKEVPTIVAFCEDTDFRGRYCVIKNNQGKEEKFVVRPDH